MVAEKDKGYERYKKNPVVLFYGKDGKELAHCSDLKPMGFFLKPLIANVIKVDSRMTRIFGAYGAFQFLERGKHWEICAFNEYAEWGLVGMFDKYPQVDEYEELLYLRAVKLREQQETDS
jgi:hypothetical protein